MKKYILGVLCILVVIGIAFTFIESLYTNDIHKAVRYLDTDSDFDIVSFGSSHGSSFKCNDLPIKGHRINKAANTLYYDYQNFSQVKEHLRPGTLVIFTVSYFSFGLDENRTLDKDDSYLNDYYEYLGQSEIYDYQWGKRTKMWMHRVQKNFKNLLDTTSEPDLRILSRSEYNKAHHHPKIIARDNKQYIASLFQNTEVDIEEHRKALSKHARQRARSHTRQAEFKPTGRQNIYYLEEAIKSCQQSSLVPVLVTTPFYRDYKKRFKQKWLHQNFYKYIIQLTQKYRVLYIDYSEDDRMTDEAILFYNSDHLNIEGKDVFAKYFFSDLIYRYGFAFNN